MILRMLLVAAFLSAGTSHAATPKVVLGLLKFGTASWEADTVLTHGLDRRHGVVLERREFASNEAAKVALLAHSVDVIVTDIIWVARQRGEGFDLSFVPFSRAEGAVVVPAQSPIHGLSDFDGRTLGVAGGPLDKSWLILRALSRKTRGRDIADTAQPVFAAPPLLAASLARDQLAGVLTYWHYAARLAAQGARVLLTVDDMMRGLGLETSVPLLCYAFHAGWADANPAAFDGFVGASREAKQLLASSDVEWRRLEPLTGTDDPDVLAKLRDGYRAGIPGPWGPAEQRAAQQLLATLAQVGGAELLGRTPRLDARAARAGD